MNFFRKLVETHSPDADYVPTNDAERVGEPVSLRALVGAVAGAIVLGAACIGYQSIGDPDQEACAATVAATRVNFTTPEC